MINILSDRQLDRLEERIEKNPEDFFGRETDDGLIIFSKARTAKGLTKYKIFDKNRESWQRMVSKCEGTQPGHQGNIPSEEISVKNKKPEKYKGSPSSSNYPAYRKKENAINYIEGEVIDRVDNQDE